jgi:hypothetical protein
VYVTRQKVPGGFCNGSHRSQSSVVLHFASVYFPHLSLFSFHGCQNKELRLEEVVVFLMKRAKCDWYHPKLERQIPGLLSQIMIIIEANYRCLESTPVSE